MSEKATPTNALRAIIFSIIGIALLLFSYNLMNNTSGRGLEDTGTVIMAILLMISGGIMLLLGIGNAILKIVGKKYGSTIILFSLVSLAIYFKFFGPFILSIICVVLVIFFSGWKSKNS